MVPVSYGVVVELAVDTPVENSIVNRYVRGIFPSVRRITIRDFSSVYISAMVSVNEVPFTVVSTNDV